MRGSVTPWHRYFFIATQKPLDLQGTYPLLEAQRNPIVLRLKLGCVPSADELNILDPQRGTPSLLTYNPVVSQADFSHIRQAAQQTLFSTALTHYIIDVVRATRVHPDVAMCASSRAVIMLMKCSQGLAPIKEHNFVTPDFVLEREWHHLALDSSP